MENEERIHIFCQELWDWFERNKRTLPWRDITEQDVDHKAYLILISEVMLQQTQVSRVIILYKKFIQNFPSIVDLAQASNREILIAWRGLGYNNRALRLRDAAREIVSRGGTFPRSMEELQELPGIGHYTAGAIRNFAFGIPTACMDVNIRRILHRFFVGPEHPDGTWEKDDRYLLEVAEKVLLCALRPSPLPVRQAGPAPFLEKGRGERKAVSSPPSSGEGLGVGARNTADFFAALMDFGSLVCTKNNPRWELMSPAMKSICMAYGKPFKRTKKVNKKEPGRMMAGRFVPNRIFRGKIVEALRDAKKGLTLQELGTEAIADWTMGDYQEWMRGLIEGLKRDKIIQEKKKKYLLAD